MKEIVGPSNTILEVDLSNQSWRTVTITDETRKQYLGGKGLGLKLIFDRIQAGVDPLGPDNILAVMLGVLMGSKAPCSGRFAAVTKSPLTGIFSSSSCGGPFGMALKTAGWDGLLISGASKAPVGLEIDKTEVRFTDATNLWGKDTETCQNALNEEKTASLVIGPAGENLVRFANVVSGHRFLGRAGFGAVMGAKKLKYVRARGGEYKIKPVDADLFSATDKKARKYLNQNHMTSLAYRKFGTASNVGFTSKHHIMPVNNFRDGVHPDLVNLSGESMAAKHQTKPHTCKPCTILCGHKGVFESDEKRSVPEYETVGLLGSNLGIFDSDIVSRWNRICTKLGMDTISTGGTLSWAIEATEKGLMKTNLAFGDSAAIESSLHDIGNANGIGKELGLGSKALSEKYGGAEFAVHVKGLELSAYDPRGSVGQGLGYAVANRGACHLSSYPVALEGLYELLNPFTARAKARFTVFLEDFYACVNSLHTCQFTGYAYVFESPLIRFTPDLLLFLVMQYLTPLAVQLIDFSLYVDFWKACTGLNISAREFIKAGRRIHVLERLMNTWEGVTRSSDTLPDRIMKDKRVSDPESPDIPLSKMLEDYYRLRGFDGNGHPTPKTLADLEIKWMKTHKPA